MGEAAGSLAPLTALAQPRADHDSSHASDERPERGPPPPRKIDSMNRIIARLLPRLGLALCATLTLPPLAQERDRAKIADKYKWNLADIYPTEAAWRAAKEKLAADLPQLATFQGKLASSAATLADALDKLYALDKELSRLYVYASMLADQDTRDSPHQGMRQEMVQLAAAFGAEAAYHRAGDSCAPTRPTLERFLGVGAAAEDLSLLPRGHRAPRRAHAQRRRGEAARRRRPARRHAVELYQHPLERRFPVSDASR